MWIKVIHFLALLCSLDNTDFTHFHPYLILILNFCLAPLLLFLSNAEFTKILIWNLSRLEGEMHCPAHLSPHGEGGLHS